ncbi:ABC transporter permease [Amycolatopsis saalfeldensis]|uniref:ABC-2 type transport system permease protein n=1 Tax=Amycolatopsis saalfeldensis TaxID=394193 RepID=A0A1H8WLR6_9PSEU|nr:ABC transporter permease [Amycolatopsis saalfeldensis]SEP28539.1 ABC-2 type transport system permease protein [Amycolatopsis saalfeldensis]
MTRISPARAVRLVAKRELNTRLRTRSFVVSTAVLLVLLCGYVALQAFLASSSSTTTIALTGQAQGIAQELQAAGAQVGDKFETVTAASEEDGQAQVRAGDANALVSGSASRLRVTVKSTLDTKLQAVLDGIVQQQVLDAQLSAAHLDPVQVRQTVSAAHVDVAPPLEPRDADHGQKLVIGLVVAILLYMSIITYGMLVAQGVVEEKSSRVVEILLSTVRPWHLLLGKVIGLGVVGLVQLGILAVVGLAVATGTGVLSVSGVAAGAAVWGIVWYLLGFLLYAMIYGAAGSLVSRQEDTQTVVGPVNIALIIGFIVGINLLTQSPDGTATRVVSLIPLLSPVLMPARIATGAAAPWEIVTSLVLTIASIALVTWLGARIYQNGVLRVGSRVKLAEALRR